jgi:hypothetical protein
MSKTNTTQQVSLLSNIGMLGHSMLSDDDLKELLGEGNFDEPLRDDE